MLYTDPMDELVIAGKKYISSKRASELSGYAKDYIGQLIREGKVLGTRVGRAWYVDMDTLLAHDSKVKTEIMARFPKNMPQRAQISNEKRLLSPSTIVARKNFQKTWDSPIYSNESVELFPQMVSQKTTRQTVSQNNYKNMDKSADSGDEYNVVIHKKAEPTHIVRTYSVQKSPDPAALRHRSTGSIPAILSLSMFSAGIVAFMSLISGLFISYVAEDTSSGYAAASFVSLEYVSDVVKDLRNQRI